ncbi:hypothetical protein [Microbacterium lacticum]|uniref:hypothetical protein n=1 Tax=Microbacterium lacticum TaxID=33885 RepID=UPI001F59A65A|nr:hypothetical protein [Microbacterium lacticum]
MNVQQLVDQVLDTAQAAHPGAEFSITLSLDNALRLPKESDKLWRKDADDREGYYSAHVYRDCLVQEVPSVEPGPIDHLVIVGPVSNTSAAADAADTYYGDLRTGDVTTTVGNAVR